MTTDHASGAARANAFAAIEREPRLSDRVADAILETIADGRMPAGASLPSERELGEQFAVSRTVIREAIRTLDAMGVVEVRSGSGGRVSDAGSARTRETLTRLVRALAPDGAGAADVHAALTVAAAGLTAERATPTTVELLRATLEDPAAGAPAFLRAVVTGAANPLLATIRDATARDVAAAAPSPAQLRGLLEAIARSDAAGARAAAAALFAREPG